MWQAIAGAVGNFISQGSGTLASLWQNSKDRQHDWSTWNAQNFYNSPAEQMIRLKQAGLNPNLVYGSGTSTLASPVPQSSSHAIPGIDNPIKTYYDLKQQDAMTQQIEANTKLTNYQSIENAIHRDNATIQGNILDTQREIMNYQKQIEADNVKMSQLRLQMLRIALPAYTREMEHKSGDWYHYWQSFGEAMHAMSPFSSSVSNFVDATSSGRR